jgi:hypothetical protein
MCIIPGDKMAEAMRDEMQRVDVMAKILNQIDALFVPALQRAREQADKIQRAAELCREVDEDAQP